MMLENKSAAHAVGVSTGGGGKRALSGLVSSDSVQEPGRLVKGGLGYAQAQRLAAMLTERQRRDIVRLALVILKRERSQEF